MNQKNSLGLNGCFLDLEDPIQLFNEWMEMAKKSEPNDPNAVALATSSKNNTPSLRMVLLKDFNEDGFVVIVNPAPLRNAELVDNIAAPVIPLEPAIIKTLPDVYLCLSNLGFFKISLHFGSENLVQLMPSKLTLEVSGNPISS